MSSPIASFAPSDTMSRPAAPPVDGTPADAPKEGFLLFGSQWLTIQNYITQGLQLPITQGDFVSKYGDFSKKSLVDDCLAAMVDVRNLSNDFGNPSSIKNLMQENQSYLFTKTPPPEIYGHIIWLSSQIQNQAKTFDFTLSSLNQIIGSSAPGTPEEQAANLKEILVGRGGLTSTAETAQKQVEELMAKLLAFDEKFKEANDKLLYYSNSESEILAEANRIIGQLTALIADLHEKADDANTQWIAFTATAISAAVLGVLLAPFTAGLSLLVGGGTAIGFGIAAALAKKRYNGLMDQIATQGLEKSKKSRLVTDLTGFNAQIGKITPVMGEFHQNLETIEGVWLNTGVNLAYIANNFRPDQLSDLSFMMQTLKVVEAQNKWKSIAKVTEQFTTKSLVSYDFSRTWGQKAA